MQIVLEIIYLILMFFVTYYASFHLVYWFENRDKFKQKSNPIKDRDLSKVSLIVPAYNEEDIIEKTILKLKKINYPKNKLEILLVDDGSKDKTYEIAKKFETEQIKVLTKPNSGKASTLNFGIKKTKNEFVAVIDADSYPEKNALRNCMKYFDEKNVAVVVAHILVGRRKTFWERMQNIEQFFVSTIRKSQEFPNVIGAAPGPLSVYRKKVLVELGGFDEKNLIEDVEITYRVLRKGYEIRNAFDAIAYSFYPPTFKKWWKQRTRWVIGGMQTLFKHLDAIIKKTYGVGGFLVPVSIFGYSSTLIGIGVFLYLASIKIFNFLIYTFKSFFIGINPFTNWEIGFYPDLVTIYGAIVFSLSLFWLWVSLRQHKWKFNFFDLFCYLVVYSFFFPFINLNGVYKYIKGERGWLTK